jgi:hypothetical protein
MDLIRFVPVVAGLLIILSTFYWAARILMVKGRIPRLSHGSFSASAETGSIS